MSLFFLAALAVVLVALSAAVYVLVRSQLFHQVNERLIAGLETFRGALEFEPNGLDWEPDRRRVYFLEAQSAGPLVWGVFEPNGNQVDGSADAVSLFADQIRPGAPQDDGQKFVRWRAQTWKIVWQTLRSDVDPGHPPPNSAELAVEEDNGKRYAELVLLVGIPIDPVLKPLPVLGLALFVSSIVIWLLFAAVGRWLSASALAPLTQMARTARSISAADLSQRLAPLSAHDELEDLGRAFNDLLTRLQISFERQQRFSGEASHQLRTPLTAMLGQLDVALRRDRNSDDYRRALESVRNQAEKLRQIVEMLLFLTRENADSPPLEFQRLELQGWLSEHLRTWQLHARRGDIQIQSDTDSPLWVAAHSGLLAQAVDNLLDNACKYSPTGSPIVVRAGRQDSKVWLAVEDHGYGIAPAELPQVFDPFFRSADAIRRGIAGTGLGLPVARRIVLAMNGDLDVQSTLGKGARFIIVLTASQDEHITPVSVPVAQLV